MGRCHPRGDTSQPKEQELILPGAAGEIKNSWSTMNINLEVLHGQLVGRKEHSLSQGHVKKRLPKGQWESTKSAESNLHRATYTQHPHGGVSFIDGGKWVQGELSKRIGDYARFLVNVSTAKIKYAKKCSTEQRCLSLPVWTHFPAKRLGILLQLVTSLKRKFMITSSYIK